MTDEARDVLAALRFEEDADAMLAALTEAGWSLTRTPPADQAAGAGGLDVERLVPTASSGVARRVRTIDCGIDECAWRGDEHYHDIERPARLAAEQRA